MITEQDPQKQAAPEMQTLAVVLGRIAEKGENQHVQVGDIATKALSSTVEVEPAVKLDLPEAVQPLSDIEVASRFETQGVVKSAPRLADQLADDARQGRFNFLKPSDSYKPTKRNHLKNVLDPVKPEGAETEQDGLRELQGFLTQYLDRRSTKVGRSPLMTSKKTELADKARDMLDNLTFLGEKEYSEAAKGIGLLWKQYLDEEPGRKLCVLTEANRLNRYSGTRKSDDYVREQVLQTFTDEELAKYSGRLVGNLDDLGDFDPAHTRVVMLDDWAISGRQMREGYERLMKRADFRSLASAGNAEINVLAASEDRIMNGLRIMPNDPNGGSIKVRAYYRSHVAPTAHAAHSSYITGLHSPVNFGFMEVCRDIAKDSRGFYHKPPKLARIYPDYRDTQTVMEITGSTLRRLTPSESLAREGRGQEIKHLAGKLIVGAPEAGEVRA